MVQIFAWKASEWTSPTRPDGTISAFLPPPPLSHSSSSHFTSYILFMCGFSFSLQNGTLGIVGEIIAFERRQEVLMLCLLFYWANEEKHGRATYLSQFCVVCFFQGLFRGRFRSSVVNRTSFPSRPPLLWLMLFLCTLLWVPVIQSWVVQSSHEIRIYRRFTRCE